MHPIREERKISNIVYNPQSVANFLEQFEEYSELPYRDEAGVPTVGIGTTIYLPEHIPVTMQDPMLPYLQAVYQLQLYCRGIIDVLNQIITVQLNENQTTSIICFCYNVGTNNFGYSTLCRAINYNGTQHDIHSAFMMWNKIKNPETGLLEISNGLVNRREKEFQLYVQ